MVNTVLVHLILCLMGPKSVFDCSVSDYSKHIPHSDSFSKGYYGIKWPMKAISAVSNYKNSKLRAI